MPTPSEKNPSLQANVDLDKKSYSTSTTTVTAGPLQMPLEKQSAAKSFETLTTLPAFWSSSRKELISPNLRVSKSDSTFHNQASVETLYVSPSFKTFDSVEKIVINKNLQEPTQPSTVQTDDENLKTLTTLGESKKPHTTTNKQTNKQTHTLSKHSSFTFLCFLFPFSVPSFHSLSSGIKMYMLPRSFSAGSVTLQLERPIGSMSLWVTSSWLKHKFWEILIENKLEKN